ncbi:MAG TPA: single-stranded DNA-binding protein, partial [Cyanobacteria bacterium UBA11368]|nr:single-stranded DNA-binding protein [Cyanobacteria bacterium UBA11368]
MMSPHGTTPSENKLTLVQSSVPVENVAVGSTQITDDLNKLLDILPAEIRQPLEKHHLLNRLVEVVMDLGRRPEARFPGKTEYLCEKPVSREDLNYSIQRVGNFSGDNRAGIEQTLHRISAIRNRSGEIIGLTCRVGRAVFGTIGMIRDLVETGKSILMLGRPGVGKTTALREIARVLADELEKRVVIIDTSNEIAGDGDIPHPAIGRARRMQVARPELQHQVMIEAVENHMPEVIVIDEIGTELEAAAARTIAERGVQLVGTAHGNQIENLIKNPTLSDLVGGIQAVTLGDEEARRRGSQKTVLERKAPPTFEIAVEMQERQRWTVHESVADTVDALLRGVTPSPQIRSVSETGEVKITRETKSAPVATAAVTSLRPTGWRASGQMTPVKKTADPERFSQTNDFERLLNASTYQMNAFGKEAQTAIASGPNGEDLPLHIYPYGIGRHQLEQVIETLNLPVVLTKDIDGADAVLAVRTQVKNHSKLRHIAKARHIPIHAIKSGSIGEITHALQRMLNMDDIAMPETLDLRLFTQNGSDDELEALEEARLAVEQIVIPKKQPVELLPRSANVRKMQH